MHTVSQTIRKRLEMQGFIGLSDEHISAIRPWLRVTTGICASWAAIATLLGSPWGIWALVPFAILGATSRNHPFDAIYNVFVRRITEGPPIPRSGAPRRFACSMAAVWLTAAGLAIYADLALLGFVLGATMSLAAWSPTLTDFCIPSFIYGRLLAFRRSFSGTRMTADREGA